MMADGLFERFPVDAIFGAHNMPGMRAGTFSTRAGGIMASRDNFVRIDGRGTRARPHMGIPIVIGAQVVLALQTIVSRNLDPGQQAVISCTEFITDGLRNVLPSTVTIRATRAATRATCRRCWPRGCARSAKNLPHARRDLRVRVHARVRADGEFAGMGRHGRAGRGFSWRARRTWMRTSSR